MSFGLIAAYVLSRSLRRGSATPQSLLPGALALKPKSCVPKNEKVELQVALVALALLGCSSSPTLQPVVAIAPPTLNVEAHPTWSDAWILAHGTPYLDNVEVRRAGLESALTDRTNLYSRTRLEDYAQGTRGWDVLPVWNPRTVSLDASAVRAMRAGEMPEIAADAAPFFGGERPTTWAAWSALGRRVFFTLPLRTEAVWTTAVRDEALGAQLGLVFDAEGTASGLVLARDLDGETRVAITCALCHAAPSTDGAIIAGRARRQLDYGLARVAYAESIGRPLSEEARARYTSWGRGRADVLEEESDVPIAIPDLYGLREEAWFTQGATLRHVSPLALAARQETQFVQANHLRTRPPRELVWALVIYLYSIAPPPRTRSAEPGVAEGQALFAMHCVGCHRNAIGSGDPVELARIGTHPELASGSARGTGMYRPSPLVRVADAAPYLHHGAVSTLEDLLDANRTEPGHRFGVDLSGEEKGALLAYLRSL